MIMDKKQAMYIQDKLNSYLDRKEQYSMFGKKAGSAKDTAKK
jgi:hypothetical protein